MDGQNRDGRRGVRGYAFTVLQRAVIEQAQSEKYPEEYHAQIEQYLLNLARDGGEKK